MLWQLGLTSAKNVDHFMLGSKYSILDDDWNVSELPALRNSAIEWLDGEAALLSRGCCLYYGNLHSHTTQLIGSVPIPHWKKVLASNPLWRRLFRLMYFNVLPIAPRRFFVTYDKTVGLISDGAFKPISLNGRFRVLRQGLGCDGDFLYFGEYFNNPTRDPVHIYRFSLQDKTPAMHRVYTFPAGAIRHIHRIQADPYTGELWCMTGDLPKECQILKTTDAFASLDIIGGGDETWRCISPLFTQKYIYYATDSEFSQNGIYRINRASGRREFITPIDGPVYYSKNVGPNLFFAVTAEGCPSQALPRASIWHVNGDKEDGIEAKKILSFKKDRLSPKLFLPGTITFPSGAFSEENAVYINTFALSHADFAVFKLSQAEPDR